MVSETKIDMSFATSQFVIQDLLFVIHKVHTFSGEGRGSRQKRTSTVFMTSFYCLKVYVTLLFIV